MKRAIIVYESVYGNTKKVAEAIADGIRSVPNIECKVAKTGEIHTDEICDYDLLVFGAPNHNQGPALNMIKFLERAAIVHVEGKMGGVFDTYTGGNKGIAVAKLSVIVKEKYPGIQLVENGISAKVEGRKGPLAKDEEQNAKNFGEKVAKKLLG